MGDGWTWQAVATWPGNTRQDGRDIPIKKPSFNLLPLLWGRAGPSWPGVLAGFAKMDAIAPYKDLFSMCCRICGDLPGQAARPRPWPVQRGTHRSLKMTVFQYLAGRVKQSNRWQAGPVGQAKRSERTAATPTNPLPCAAAFSCRRCAECRGCRAGTRDWSLSCKGRVVGWAQDVTPCRTGLPHGRPGSFFKPVAGGNTPCTLPLPV